jgi:hypothetical protein
MTMGTIGKFCLVSRLILFRCVLQNCLNQPVCNQNLELELQCTLHSKDNVECTNYGLNNWKDWSTEFLDPGNLTSRLLIIPNLKHQNNTSCCTYQQVPIAIFAEYL